MGHENALPRPRANGRCRFGQGTIAGTRGNGRDAPKAVDGATTKALIGVLEIEQASSETLEDSHNGQVSLRRRSAERLTGESWTELRLPSRR
jgi:hypothetical protein